MRETGSDKRIRARAALSKLSHGHVYISFDGCRRNYDRPAIIIAVLCGRITQHLGFPSGDDIGRNLTLFEW